MRKQLLLTLAMILSVLTGGITARGNTTKGFYWFNHGPTVPFAPGAFEIDTDGLPEGFHTLHAFVERGNVLSSVVSRMFVKTPHIVDGAEHTALVYMDGAPFFQQKVTKTAGVFSLDLDCSALSLGVHLVSAQIVTPGGGVTTLGSGVFVKNPVMIDGEEQTAIIFIDGTPFTQAKVRPSQGQFYLDIDCSSVPIGAHSLSVQIVTAAGVATAFHESFFYRVPSESELTTLRGYYLLDSNFAGNIDLDKKGNLCHLDIDASQLAAGIHSVTLFLASPYGLATSPQTSWFVKVPKGGEGVVRYEYWLNDNYANVRKVELEKAVNPMSLMSLIDIDKEPFCSKRYEFAIEEGKPVIYGCNDFKIRFFDGDGRMSSATGSFTDTRVREAVDEVEVLPREETHLTVPNLSENTIKWFSFDGEVGDSVSVKLDRGAMIEVYAPDGSPLVKRQGPDATALSSLILDKTGVYYIAVHDIYSRYDKNVSLDFDHIRKFDIIRNTPEKGSRGSDLYIDILGNGFDSLESISLVGNGTSISPKDLRIRDRYNITVQFDVKDPALPLGEYDLVAVFNNSETGQKETVTRKAAITLGEPEPVVIEVKINTPFRPATPYEVNIEVINKSGTPCWGIPFNFAVNQSQKGFAISFKNFYPYEGSGFEFFVRTGNLLGTGVPGYFFPTVIPYLGPHETITLTLGFRSDPMERIRMYAWAGKPWSEEFKEILDENFDLTEITELKTSNLISARTLCYAYAAYREMVDNKSGNGASPVRRLRRLNMSSDLAGYNANVAQASGQALGSLYNGMRLHDLNSRLDAYGIDLSNETFSSLADYQNNLKQGMYNPEHILSTAFGHEELYQLAHEITTEGASCPNPMPEPHDFYSYQSGDPNDMKGYESPSGSTYIGCGVKTLDYTIEFENDPLIANASAMSVSVSNELDGSVFDLNSFRPLTMQLGDKTVELPSEHSFVKTIDMRPEINAIAELTFNFDSSTGKADWIIKSLDPFTLDEARYMEDGILPVNDESGRGCGYLTYSIDLREGLSDGTRINNSAVIVFDNNDPISTPVWSNTTDYVLPTSQIDEMRTDDNKTFLFKVSGEDSGSGIWMYDLYVQTSGSDEWIAVKSQIEDDEFTYVSEEALEGAKFTVIATDLAGNRQALPAPILLGDADGNGLVDANDVVVISNYYLEVTKEIDRRASDVNSDGIIDSQDALTTSIIYLDTTINSKHIRTRKRQ